VNDRGYGLGLGSEGELGSLQMNLRSVGRGVSEAQTGVDDDTRTFPIRRVYGNGLDLNEDFIITGHRNGHLLNQRGAVLNSDRHQSLRLGRVGGGRPTGWVTTAFMRGGTPMEDMGVAAGGSEQAREMGCGITTLYSYREQMREGASSNLM